MAATRPTERHLTLDAFLEMPEAEPSLEYFKGAVKQKVAPLGEHSVLQFEVLKLLDGLVGQGETGRAFPELRFTTDGASCVPDVSVYGRKRIPRTPSGRVARQFLIPPDLAVEIRSPGQTVRELSKRCEWYVDHGVRVALLVDDEDESIRVFRAGRAVEIARGDDHIALDELAPGAAMAVKAVFSALIIE